MFYSIRPTSIALTCALGAAVLGFAGQAPPEPPLRPSVTLILEMQSRSYRSRMGDPDCTTACAALLQQLAPAVRSALSREFPFIDWTPGAATSRDTIVVAWQDDPTTSVPATRLEFRLKGPRGSDSTRAPVDFENGDTVTLRADADWQPSRLVPIWVKLLPEKLEGGDLVPQVFGRVPLGARTTFVPVNATVRAHPESIKAEPRKHPDFEVRVTVDHAAINDDGLVKLTGCTLGAGRAVYSCPVSVIQIQQRQLSGAELRAALLAPNGVKAIETRLLTFKAKAGAGIALSGPSDQ